MDHLSLPQLHCLTELVEKISLVPTLKLDYRLPLKLDNWCWNHVLLPCAFLNDSRKIRKNHKYVSIQDHVLIPCIIHVGSPTWSYSMPWWYQFWHNSHELFTIAAALTPHACIVHFEHEIWIWSGGSTLLSQHCPSTTNCNSVTFVSSQRATPSNQTSCSATRWHMNL